MAHPYSHLIINLGVWHLGHNYNSHRSPRSCDHYFCLSQLISKQQCQWESHKEVTRKSHDIIINDPW